MIRNDFDTPAVLAPQSHPAESGATRYYNAPQGAVPQSAALAGEGVNQAGGPSPYRRVLDTPEAGRDYQQARKLYDLGQKKEALPLIQNYLARNARGQFADEAAYLLGIQAAEVADHQLAANYFASIVRMDPPSKLRGDATYYQARAEAALGKRQEALRTLANLDARELSAASKRSIFLFWAKLSAEESRWLESVLAYVKARKETVFANPQQKKDLEDIVQDQIETRLNEAELNFVLQQYPTSFPQHLVQMRLVAIKLADGDRNAAQGLLQAVIATAAPGSIPYVKANELLGRLQSLGVAASGRVGALLPLSGAQESLGRSIFEGLSLALEGARGGTPIEIVRADSGTTVESALSAFDRLVFQDKVMVVVGPISGPQAEALSSKAVEYGIPYISLSSRNVTEKGSSIFRVALSTEKQVRALVSYAQEKLNAKNFGILFSEDRFGQEYASTYFQTVEAAGGKVTAAESYDPNQSDFRVQIDSMVGTAFPSFRKDEYDDILKNLETKLGRVPTRKELAQAKLAPIVDFDVLFIPDFYKPVGQIAPALEYADVNSVQLMGPSSWNSPKLLERAGQHLEKALFVDVFAASRPGGATKEFVERYQAKKGSLPNAFSAVGYDVGTAIRMAYGNSRAPESRDELRSRLEVLGSIDGALGLQQWDGKRDPLSEAQLFQIRRASFNYLGGILLR